MASSTIAAPAATPDIAPETLRKHFQLDTGITFLNHGSFGATPKPVFDVYQAWQRELEREPVAFFARRQEALLDAARGRIGTWLNADPDTLSFVVNATSGLNVIARSLSLGPGDEILTTDLEYGALDLTWEHLCAKAGARYFHQPISLPVTSKEEVVETIWAGVSDRTRAIFLSHITSGTTLILPVQEICARAREVGILTIIDGAHVPGQLDLDMEAIGADAYSGNFHKWLCTPKGSAFLYVRPEQHGWIESLTISWGWMGEHTFVTRNQKQATRDVSAFLAVGRAIDFQREHNWDAVRDRCFEMLSTLRQELHAKWGTTAISPDTPDWYRQLATITLPDSAPDDLQDRLFHNHAVEVPITRHGDRRFIRVSVQGYTTERDLDALRTALNAEITTGA
ncbi:MAG TPA: aminotransferase class V-fold PLP-dependent enzyme [Thermomicrobiales bacterium]|nr:aminotransferase class V-fold PLP-dependent enzyme [Thermomicrobiales bacterium]